MGKFIAVIATLMSGLLAFSGSCLASPANLVINGDFENPAIGNYYQTISAGQTGLTGWNVGGVSIDIVSTIQGNTKWAYTGTQSVDMAGTSGPGTIDQSLTTSPNTTYKLTFSLSSNADQTNGFTDSLKVYWGGDLKGTFSSPTPGTWNTYNMYLTAAASSTELLFFTPINTNQGPLLDNVSLNAVPIPPAAWLLGSGLIGLVALRRRFGK